MNIYEFLNHPESLEKDSRRPIWHMISGSSISTRLNMQKLDGGYAVIWIKVSGRMPVNSKI